MIATGIGAGLAWNSSQQAIANASHAWAMDKARLLSQQIDTELQLLRSDVLQVYSTVQSIAPTPDSVSEGAVKFEAGPWIHDMALWQKSATNSKPERVALAINTTREGSVSAWQSKLKLADSADELNVKDALLFLTPRVVANTAFKANGNNAPSWLLTYMTPVKEKDPTSPMIVVHLEPARLKKLFDWKDTQISEAEFALIDQRGIVIAYRNEKFVDGAHLYKELMPGAPWITAQLRWGGWQVVVSKPAEGLMAVTRAKVIWSAAVLLFFEFFTFATVIWGWPRRNKLLQIDFFKQFKFLEKIKFLQPSKPKFKTESEITPPPFNPEAHISPTQSLCFVLAGQLRGLDSVLEKSGHLGPDEVMDSLREFHAIIRHRVSQSEGKFDALENGAFVISWDSDAARKALMCTLDLRKDFAAWMESRKVDGKGILKLAAAMHQGHLLSGTLVGQVFQDARVLCGVSASMDVDLLISQAVWDSMQGFAVGESVGDVKLTDATGLVAAYFVKGYRDGAGDTQLIETSLSGKAKNISLVMSKKWLVNNGSTIEGPLTAQEIASRLYSQEIDFDSECWEDGNGKSSVISQAGIFSGTEDAGADLWVFDGQTIHGPVTEKFISVAIERGALSTSSYFCKGSTLQGWQPINKATAASLPQVDLDRKAA